MSEGSAKALWWSLVATIIVLSYMLGPLGFLLGAILMWLIVEVLSKSGLLPPRDSESRTGAPP